jgi:hypothetical protein
VKLICALLSTNIYEINVQFKNLKTIDILLDLFFKYSLNNFLHAQVEQCIQFLFTWNPQTQIPDPSSKVVDNEDCEKKEECLMPEGMAVENEEAQNSSTILETLRTQDSLANEDEDQGTSPNKSTDMSTDVMVQEGSLTDKPENTVTRIESGKKEEVVEEEDKSDDEMTIDTPNSDATESNCTDMAELTPNPDLEWETTAMAEAKKLSEIQSDIPYENPLLMHLYIDCGIVDRVVKAWEENEGQEPKRRGYMGHLTRIANIMQHHAENKTLCHDFVIELMQKLPEQSRSGWESFVSGKLAEINEKNTIVPATSYSAGTTLTSSEDDDSDFREIQFQSESLQQIFSDYRMQQMSDNFIDSFGFNDDEFNEPDDGAGTKKPKKVSTPMITQIVSQMN